MKPFAIPRPAILGALAAGALGLLGCGSGLTTYQPQLRAWGELTLRYDNGFSMVAEGKQVAEGQSWSGLSEYVQCVPEAKKHAEAAESAGAAATALSWTGAGIGLASLGSLASLADYDKHQETSNIILTVGLTAAVTGVILAAIGRHEKPVSNGHAVDAMNYYNDAVGSLGGTCKKPAPELQQVEAPPKAKPEGKKPDAPKDTPKPEENKGSPSTTPKIDI